MQQCIFGCAALLTAAANSDLIIAAVFAASNCFTNF